MQNIFKSFRIREILEITILNRALRVMCNFLFKRNGIRTDFVVIHQSLQHPFLQGVEEKLSNCNPCLCGLGAQLALWLREHPALDKLNFLHWRTGQEDRGHRKWDPCEASTPAASPQVWGEPCRPPALKPSWCLDPSLLPKKMSTAPTWNPAWPFQLGCWASLENH